MWIIVYLCSFTVIWRNEMSFSPQLISAIAVWKLHSLLDVEFFTLVCDNDFIHLDQLITEIKKLEFSYIHMFEKIILLDIPCLNKMVMIYSQTYVKQSGNRMKNIACLRQVAA